MTERFFHSSNRGLMAWIAILSSTLVVFGENRAVFGDDGKECTMHRNAKEWCNSLEPKGEKGSKLVLVKEGKSDYQIVLGANHNTQEEKAALDLQCWLEEMTGAKLAIIKDDQELKNENKIISVGLTKQLALSGLNNAQQGKGKEWHRIATDGSRLFLWGGPKRGTIYAVYALLEEDLGCRWYSKECTRIPSRPTLEFSPVVRTYSPPLRLRDPFVAAAFNADWALRNRLNFPCSDIPEEWGGRIDYGDLFVHTFHRLVPPDLYFDKHPEYFMLNENGLRDKWQLCSTHPDVIAIVVKNVKESLKAKPFAEILSVSKSDGGNQTCQCERCKALDDAEGTKMASLLCLVNAVAEEIGKEYPEVTISTLAYQETSKLPKTVRPRENVAIRLCNDAVGAWKYPFTPIEETEVGKFVKEWSGMHDRVYIWDYCINFKHYMAPMPNMDVIAKNIRFLVDHNVEGIMTQGAAQGPGSEREYMRAWVIGKLMLDPSRDVHELMNEFDLGYYGNAARPMQAYDELLRQQVDKYQPMLRDKEEGITFSMDNDIVSESFLAEATRLFDEAEQLAENDDVLNRVQQTRMSIMYVKLARGPEFVGEDYGTILAKFEGVARRTGVTYLEENWTTGPNFERIVSEWQDKWRDYVNAKISGS